MGSAGSASTIIDKQYFVAIIPPTPIYEEALKQKEYFMIHHNSKASLNSPPHITLHMPFRWNERKEDELVNGLMQFSDKCQPFRVKLDNFSSFPPRVIFINVVASPELEMLQLELKRYCKRTLNLFNANYRELPFHAHLTVAFRDLRKASFHEAWEEIRQKTFTAEFNVDRIVLLKHDGRVWQSYRDLLF